MLNRDILQYLNCCLSSDEHFVEFPVLLSCQHYTCSSCIPSGVNYRQIKCNFCKRQNERDLNESFDSRDIHRLINENIPEMMSFTRTRFHEAIERLKYDLNTKDDCIDALIGNSKLRIGERIGFYKAELDKLNAKICNELDDMRTKYKKFKSDNPDLYTKFNPTVFEKDLEVLNSKLNDESNLIESNLQLYQRKIRNLKGLIFELGTFQPTIIVKNSPINIDKSIIADISFSIIDDKNFVQNIKTPSCFSVEVQKPVNGLCVLPNGNLVVSCCESSELLVLDKNFKLVKRVDKINNEEIKPFSVCTTNDKNEIFISDNGNHRIIKTDLDFKQLRTFGYGSGSSLQQLRYPTGLCFSGKSLFVCDSWNERIQELDANLEFQATYSLDYNPGYIKILNKTACVRPHLQFKDPNTLYFYGLPGFSIRNSYKQHNGIIGTIGTFFYEYYDTNKTLYCYDCNGNLLEETCMNDRIMNGKNECGEIVGYNSRLLIGIDYGSRLYSFAAQ